MGRGIVLVAQETPMPKGPLPPSPQTDTGGTIGTAMAWGTGWPLKHPVIGCLGLTIGATVMWDKGGSIRQKAAGSRGVPIVWDTVQDPVMAINQMSASDPCMKIKQTVAWDQGMELDAPWFSTLA